MKGLNSSTILQFRVQLRYRKCDSDHTSFCVHMLSFSCHSTFQESHSLTSEAQDRTEHQKQAGNTAHNTCLAIFSNTLTDTKQERQNCSLLPTPCPSVTAKCRQSSNLNNYSNSLPAGLLCSMQLIPESASCQLERLKQLQPAWAVIFAFAAS